MRSAPARGDAAFIRARRRVDGVTTARRRGRRAGRRHRGRRVVGRASAGWPGSTSRCARTGARKFITAPFPASSASRRPRRSSSTRTRASRCAARAPGSCSGIGRRDEAPIASAPSSTGASSRPLVERAIRRAPGAGRRPADARRGPGLYEMTPDQTGHRQRRARRRRPLRDRRLQRPRLHARARSPASSWPS